MKKPQNNNTKQKHPQNPKNTKPIKKTLLNHQKAHQTF